MQNYYEQLRDKKGEAAAKKFMQKIRGNVKNNKGGGFNNPETRAKALATREKNVLLKTQLLQDGETRQER